MLDFLTSYQLFQNDSNNIDLKIFKQLDRIFDYFIQISLINLIF